MVEVSPTAPVRAMELITMLNRCHRFRGFVYQQAHFRADKKSIEVDLRPRRRLFVLGLAFSAFPGDLTSSSISASGATDEADSRTVPATYW